MSDRGWLGITTDGWLVIVTLASVVVSAFLAVVSAFLTYATLLLSNRTIVEIFSMAVGRSGVIGRHSEWAARRRARNPHKHVA